MDRKDNRIWGGTGWSERLNHGIDIDLNKSDPKWYQLAWTQEAMYFWYTVFKCFVFPFVFTLFMMLMTTPKPGLVWIRTAFLIITGLGTLVSGISMLIIYIRERM